MKNKTLEEYMKTPYRVNIIPDVESGGYVAYFPDLVGCITVGETPDDLAYMIEDAKRCWLTAELEDGHSIPEPCYDPQFEYSGQFKLRLPKNLHKQLSLEAKNQGVSLNQYCVYLLSQNNAIHTIQNEVKKENKTKTDTATSKLKPALSMKTKSNKEYKL